MFCCLAYDDEAQNSTSLADLISVYRQRILIGSVRHGHFDAGLCCLALVGYGAGAGIAHCLAVQFADEGYTVALVIINGLVTGVSTAFLGGEAEAALALAIQKGFFQSAADARTAALLSLQQQMEGGGAGQLGKDALNEMHMRLFWELRQHVSWGDFKQEVQL